MNREEIREIAEAVVQSNVEFSKLADGLIEKAIEMGSSGRLLPGLIFEVTADEVRRMLRARASKLREEASAAESGLPAKLAEAKKLAEANIAAMAGGVPGVPGMRDVAAMIGRDRADSDVQDALRHVEQMTIEEVRIKRADADRFDWKASHLAEKKYMLSPHDLEMLLPTEVPSVGLPPSYASYARGRGRGAIAY